MHDLAELASWYEEGEGFNPYAQQSAGEQEILRRVEETAASEGRYATFADALIALHEDARE